MGKCMLLIFADEETEAQRNRRTLEAAGPVCVWRPEPALFSP